VLILCEPYYDVVRNWVIMGKRDDRGVSVAG